MEEETKSQIAMKWVRAKTGSSPEIYANVAHPSWTIYDVRLQFGRVIMAEESPNDLVVENAGAVTLSWNHAKVLRDRLTVLISLYETINGELKKPELAEVLENQRWLM